MGVREALSGIRARINEVCGKISRDPDDITIIGISKTKSAELVTESVMAGITNIGESYIQEAMPKIDKVSENIPWDLKKKLKWHFVGRLQSNKIKYMGDSFSYIHSVDSEKQLIEINKRISSELGIFFELNIGDEQSKGGAGSEQIINLIDILYKLNDARQKNGIPVINPMGLMCIPPYSDSPEHSRPYFAGLRETLEKINSALGIKMQNLSMGMSGDFDIAIREGATHVRIGTLLYGERSYN
ncbi:MAG: YggS family pyridoxal phosphate-dependent enzyme [Oligoflexia bacterium]|nr:YggS family pyridoxal phosphate-dependent enzyme [Oligoflexia bacterium]